MAPIKPKRARRNISSEANELTPAPDEDEFSDHSSGPDSADSGDEADFIQGIDPTQDIVDDVKEEETEVSCSPEASCTPRRGRPRGKRSRSETLSGDVAGWKSEKEPDSLPHPPLHFLPKRKPGVQPPLSRHATSPSPSELFMMYFDQAAVQTLCDNTNKNVAKNIAAGKKFSWTELRKAEMYQYIGLTLYMGMLKLPKVKDFWRGSSIFHVPYPHTVMSRARFLAIAWNVHMSNPAKDVFNDSRKGTADYDCLQRVRPLYDHLRAACKAVYHPQQNLSVDERLVATRARIFQKQYLNNKLSKSGIKLFVLSDNTGYTVDFSIYTGRSTLGTGKGLSFEAMMTLVNKNYLGSGYHVYCDNFYTSPELFHHLYDLGIGACGTYQDTRIGVPKTKANALSKKSPQGTIRWIRKGPLVFIKWMDTREVRVCSTVHTAFSGDTVKRACKVSGKETDVKVPTAVKDCYRFMCGVGLSDQLIGSYSSWRKSRKWYVTALHHFIDIAATNSYLLHKELCGRLRQQAMTHQAFQEQLTAELCGVHAQVTPMSYHHFPVAIVEGTSGQLKATQGRRKCGFCGKCTPFMCEACRVPLCVILDRNCHKAFHTPGAAEN
ncbi:piggyBac transposable element-derived protein 4 isoform X2 [Kryptolebias marmoratus]|uniref:piggyBac transposable element-derived protein 4 isoform X2 n=1 Tax=Kryptolebias marmoratus TaxID=37003 RepID=UPI0007F86E35|nr:piggyBac transposable element-derived protein 4 isoform X2 [Kryptolebias marmoratus]